MQNAPLLTTVLLVSALGIAATGCSDDQEEEAGSTHGSCDLRGVQPTCMESWASEADTANQKDGCIDAGGSWADDACPTDGLIGCCAYTLGNEFRECFYDGYTADPVMTCMGRGENGEGGVWTPAN